ncbi:hypothetical protein [Moorena producens]
MVLDRRKQHRPSDTDEYRHIVPDTQCFAKQQATENGSLDGFCFT